MLSKHLGIHVSRENSGKRPEPKIGLWDSAYSVLETAAQKEILPGAEGGREEEGVLAGPGGVPAVPAWMEEGLALAFSRRRLGRAAAGIRGEPLDGFHFDVEAANSKYVFCYLQRMEWAFSFFLFLSYKEASHANNPAFTATHLPLTLCWSQT